MSVARHCGVFQFRRLQGGRRTGGDSAGVSCMYNAALVRSGRPLMILLTTTLEAFCNEFGKHCAAENI